MASSPLMSMSVRGVAGVRHRLEELAGRAGNPRAVWPLIIKELTDMEKARFDSSGFGSWPKLADSTIEWKKRLGQDSNHILYVTGALERSLTSLRGPGAVRTTTNEGIRFGTSVFYARFHQYAKRLPRRRLLDTDLALRARITKILERYIVGHGA